MALVTLEEGKTYLRVDADYEDDLIATLIQSAENLCKNIARLSDEKWARVCGDACDDEEDTQELETIRQTVKVAILYTVAYFYEHREKADHHDLVLTLRSLLFAIREGVI